MNFKLRQLTYYLTYPTVPRYTGQRLSAISPTYQILPPLTLLSAPNSGTVIGTVTAGMSVNGVAVSSDGQWIQISTSTGMTGCFLQFI